MQHNVVAEFRKLVYMGAALDQQFDRSKLRKLPRQLKKELRRNHQFLLKCDAPMDTALELGDCLAILSAVKLDGQRVGLKKRQTADVSDENRTGRANGPDRAR